MVGKINAFTLFKFFELHGYVCRMRQGAGNGEYVWVRWMGMKTKVDSSGWFSDS